MLSSLCVLITAPQPKAAELADRIMAQRGRAFVFPTFSVEVTPDPSLLIAALKILDQTDLAIFVSPNAVHYTLPLWQQCGLKRPKVIAAVGKSTQAALYAYQLPSVVCPDTAFNSEALLNLPELTDVGGKTVMIFQGQTGRGLLESVLQNRGAKVTLVSCYQRVLSNPLSPEQELAWQQAGINGVIYTSAEGMLNLFKLVSTPMQIQLKKIPSLVISPRLAEIAQQVTIEIVIQSRNAQSESIILALQDYYIDSDFKEM